MKLLVLFFFAVTPTALVESIIDPETTLQNGNYRFTAKMFSEVVKNNKEMNVVLSAFSTLIPLAHIVLAAEGQSHDELLNAIGFNDDQMAQAVSLFIHKKFRSIKGTDFKMVNRLYVRSNYQIKDEFDEMTRKVFHTEIVKANFDDKENTTEDINVWVESQTNRRIQNFVNPGFFNNDTRAVLVNALYFKGTWKYRFDELNTKDKDFYVNNQKTIQIPTMNIKSRYKYRQSRNLNSKLLSLLYDGEESSLLFVLPNDKEGIEDIIKILKNPYILDDEAFGMYETNVDVSIPKFKIETTIDLKDFLKKINVTNFFGKDANLKRLLKSDVVLYINSAVQKVFIEINENGVEGAAANTTTSSLPTSSEKPQAPRTFIADHPFIFFLRADDHTLLNGIFYGA